MILLVSYDLKAPGRNYQALYDLLKSAPGWSHYLESTWVIATQESASAWTEKIRQVIDAGDRFLIVDISRQDRNGWLPKKAWEWLTQHDS